MCVCVGVYSCAAILTHQKHTHIRHTDTSPWRENAYDAFASALSWGYRGVLNRNAIHALETSGYPRARGIRTIQDLLKFVF